MKKNSPQMPMVSVVITTYNRAEMVRRAIESVLNQTYKDFELIVVDDCSNDNTEEVVKNFRHPRLHYVRHDKNRGLAPARNTGIRAAHGKYIAFLDDDDEWKPQKLQKQIELAGKLGPDYAIVYCGLEVKDNSGSVVARNIPRLRGDIKDEIVRKGLNTIPSSCLFRKEALVAVNGFDTDLYTGIDHDIWMKMAKYGYKADYINEPMVVHVRHDKSTMTGDVHQRITGIEQYLNKWRPDILNWFGPKAGNKYSSDYYVNVVGRLGLSLILTGDEWHGKRVLWKAFSKEPKSFLFSPRLILALCGGKYLYNLLRTSMAIARNGQG